MQGNVSGGVGHHLPSLLGCPWTSSPGGSRASFLQASLLLWGKIWEVCLRKTLPVFTLLDTVHFFAYSLPEESLHFSEGIINLSMACQCSPCQRAEVGAGQSWPKAPRGRARAPLITWRRCSHIRRYSCVKDLFCYLPAQNLHKHYRPGQL